MDKETPNKKRFWSNALKVYVCHDCQKGIYLPVKTQSNDSIANVKKCLSCCGAKEDKLSLDIYHREIVFAYVRLINKNVKQSVHFLLLALLVVQLYQIEDVP